MKLGMIGLGRMGGNMAERLLRGGHQVTVFDQAKSAQAAVVSLGGAGADSIRDLTQKLPAPRVVWVMAPSGGPTEKTVSELGDLLLPGDIVVDGGNSHYRDSMRRATMMSTRGIRFLDIGTSGGIWGLKEGYCMMVGGSREAFHQIEPVLKTLAPSAKEGYGYVGPSGAGHFVKMVHNGVEYGMMEAYGEGFELMQAKSEFGLHLGQIAEIWRHGSVVRSWLLDLTVAALREDPGLEKIEAYVEDSGEGRWTVQEAIELGVPMPAISQALQVRFRSRQSQPFVEKLLAALRNQFGGHAVRTAGGGAVARKGRDNPRTR